MVVEHEPSRGGIGLWSRKSIALQVFGVVALAALGAGLLTYLASMPSLRARIDLTAVGKNTLDETLGGLIDALPDKVTVDVFFRPVDAPLTRVGAEAQSRMAELLFVARNQFPAKLRVVEHDLSDVSKVAIRMRELGIEEDNVVVLTRNDDKVVLRLLRDIARVDPGNPALHVEPSLESFRGEEAMGNALLRLSIDEQPRIAFTVGHGERDLYDVEKSLNLGRLRAALVSDGFFTDRWDSTQTPEIPAETRVLAIVDPSQPFTPGEVERIVKFVESGGRLLVATSTHAAAFGVAGSAEELLARFGIQTAAGFVAMPVPDGFGGWRTGLEQCGTIVVAGSNLELRHPITESLARSEARVGLPNTRAFAALGAKPKNSVLIDLLRSPELAWRDLPTQGGRGDWKFDSRLEEAGPFALAMALAFPPAGSELDQPDINAERKAARVVALGSPDALSNDALARNRDFALNTFNWLAQRDRRLVIRPRAFERRVLDVRNSTALTRLNVVAWGVLPGSFALLGFLIALRRRR